MIIGFLTASRSAPHGFFHREIGAVELLRHHGRVRSTRPEGGGVSVPEPMDAQAKAVAIDAGGMRRTLALGAAFVRPRALLQAVRLAIRIGRRSSTSVLPHLASIADACLVLRACRREGIEHLEVRRDSPSALLAMLAERLGGPSYSLVPGGELNGPPLLPLELVGEEAAARPGPGPTPPAAGDDGGDLPVPSADEHCSSYETSVQSSPTGRVLRWAGAQVWRASGRVGRNRTELYGGEAGLRIVIFHLTPREKLDGLKRAVEWWGERRPLATPEDIDALMVGRLDLGGRDRLLVTFDDGLARHHEAATWLASVGVRGVFFVIPSLLDRTVGQFVRYHAERGVRAFPPVADGAVRGLSSTQVREMLAMGHRIGGHNDAHRDLGALHSQADLHHEIDVSRARLAEVTGAPCDDFAVAFGQPQNLSTEAVQYLQQRCAKVYMCHRGLNVPGRTPRFLLRHAHELGHPLDFMKVCLQGGADHRLWDRIQAMKDRAGLLPSCREPGSDARMASGVVVPAGLTEP